ncbi:hypothetical protein [Leptothoe kymatousa]|uniref:Uncharacterized protein n=1 Tax=Leptothoe kymatousa TAU-MAC 1615 TaxID=2364775 RepID=A0ABS5Y0J0_9CYAN|nr:hypothetical protein [Leptothoe kymatousa]MBT9311331.1 hypothetical protein [Leptothoe kymatousa TAU-MAC 1615]
MNNPVQFPKFPSKKGFSPQSNQALLLSTAAHVNNNEHPQELLAGDALWQMQSRSLAIEIGQTYPSIELFPIDGKRSLSGANRTVKVGRYRLYLLPSGILGDSTVTLPVSAILGEYVPHLYLVVDVPQDKQSPIRVISGLCHDQLYRYCRSALGINHKACTIPLREFTTTPQQVWTYLKCLAPEIIIPF